jgi:hypothetical protein
MGQSDFRHALLVELHRAIDEAADAALDVIESRGIELVYPPGVELTAEEIAALTELRVSPPARSALGKVLRDAAAGPLFDFFTLVDGVGDPRGWPGPEAWLGVVLTPRTADGSDEDGGDTEMWHDQLFESYWEYQKPRDADA